MVTTGRAYTVLAAAGDLDPRLGARGARAWGSHFPVVALLGVLDVLGLNVLVFNLLLLTLKAVQAAIAITAPLVVVALGSLFHLVVVDELRIRIWVILIY